MLAIVLDRLSERWKGERKDSSIHPYVRRSVVRLIARNPVSASLAAVLVAAFRYEVEQKRMLLPPSDRIAIGRLLPMSIYLFAPRTSFAAAKIFLSIPAISTEFYSASFLQRAKSGEGDFDPVMIFFFLFLCGRLGWNVRVVVGGRDF